MYVIIVILYTQNKLLGNLFVLSNSLNVRTIHLSGVLPYSVGDHVFPKPIIFL